MLARIILVSLFLNVGVTFASADQMHALHASLKEGQEDTPVNEVVQAHLNQMRPTGRAAITRRIFGMLKGQFRQQQVNLDELVNGKTALQKALQNDYLDAAEMLITSGANINAPDADGNSALHHAVLANDPMMTILILAKGGDVNVQNKDGHTPLMAGVVHHGKTLHSDIANQILMHQHPNKELALNGHKAIDHTATNISGQTAHDLAKKHLGDDHEVTGNIKMHQDVEAGNASRE